MSLDLQLYDSSRQTHEVLVNMFDDPKRRAHALQVLRVALSAEDSDCLVRAPLAQATRVVDPSADEDLRHLGVAYVTTLVEDLARNQLVAEPTPLFTKHGPWIGFRLTTKGREQATNPTLFRSRFAVPDGLLDESVRGSVVALLDEAERTMAVSAWCASIMLYGRVVETVCLGLAIKHEVVKGQERVGLDAIINRLKRCHLIPHDDVINNALKLLKAYRNLAVHPRSWAATASEMSAELMAQLPNREDARAMEGLVASLFSRFGNGNV